MLNGKHLIAGEWLGSASTFASQPAHGSAHNFAVGTVDLVGRACEAAEEAFWSFGYSSRDKRAEFLHRIADEIDARGDLITQIGTQETGLPEARIQGERGRTVGHHAEADERVDGGRQPEQHASSSGQTQPAAGHTPGVEATSSQSEGEKDGHTGV